MKIFKFFSKLSKKRKIDSFADFFLYASEEEKKKVFIKAAQCANEEQRMLVNRVGTIQRKTT